MDSNLFYEISNVLVRQDVLEGFKTAKKVNAKWYRCVRSNTGDVYGVINGEVVNIKNIRSRIGVLEKINGVDWFINTEYNANGVVREEEPIVYEVVLTQAPLQAVEEVEEAEEKPVEREPEVDYKALFEAQKETLAAKTKEYEIAKRSLIKAREAQVKTLGKIEEVQETIKELNDTIAELKDDINDIKYINLE